MSGLNASEVARLEAALPVLRKIAEEVWTDGYRDFVSGTGGDGGDLARQRERSRAADAFVTRCANAVARAAADAAEREREGGGGR